MKMIFITNTKNYRTGLVSCGQDKEDNKKVNDGNNTTTKQEDKFENFAKMLGENGFLQK